MLPIPKICFRKCSFAGFFLGSSCLDYALAVALGVGVVSDGLTVGRVLEFTCIKFDNKPHQPASKNKGDFTENEL